MFFFGEGDLTRRDMAEGVKNVHFIGNVLNGCSRKTDMNL